MDYFECGSARLAYQIFGSGEDVIVIDAALGSCSAEWWHIAKELSNIKQYKILVYDRAGYGESSVSNLPRTPKNVALDLNKLLENKKLDRNIILVGHSQGGCYAVEYAAMFPNNVKGIVLLDPLTPFDYEFKEKLTDSEYKKSGVDKTPGLKMGKILTSLRLGFALKSLFLKSPPFYYYPFAKDAQEYQLKSLTKKSTYTTALEEYKYTHNEKDMEDIIKAIHITQLGHIPLKLITHSSDFYMKELQQYCRLDKNTSEKIEIIWQDIMKRYLSISLDSEHITAPNSGHYIHLTDYEIVKNAIESCSRS